MTQKVGIRTLDLILCFLTSTHHLITPTPTFSFLVYSIITIPSFITMLSLLSIFTFIPLAVSAARIPHHVLDLDASLVSDTKSTLDLGLVPRSPNPAPGIFDVVNNVPIVSNVVNTVTQILPDIDAGVSFCVTLGADANLQLGSESVFLAAGICLCIDADVEVGNGPNAISIKTSAGQTLRGALAIKLRKSVSHPLTPFSYTLADL
jgi:hypothetical protein